METNVKIPASMRTLTQGADEVTAEGETVTEIVADLERRFPGMKDRLMDEKGVRRFINVFVGDEDIRFLEGLGTKLQKGDVISIIPAIAGG